MIAVAATVIVPTAVALIVAVARKRGANYRPSRSYVLGGTTIGLLCIFVLIAGGHPWSVTFRYTVWGAKISSALGFDFSHAAFWQWPGPKYALSDSMLSDTSRLTDFGMLFVAVAAAAASMPVAATVWPPRSSASAAISAPSSAASPPARCTAGSGLPRRSPGCLIGMRLRPLFGLSRE